VGLGVQSISRERSVNRRAADYLIKAMGMTGISKSQVSRFGARSMRR
jgi:hypothetical protein